MNHCQYCQANWYIFPDLAYHQKVCMYRPLMCGWCGNTVPYNYYKAHYMTCSMVVLGKMDWSRFSWYGPETAFKFA